MVAVNERVYCSPGASDRSATTPPAPAALEMSVGEVESQACSPQPFPVAVAVVVPWFLIVHV